MKYIYLILCLFTTSIAFGQPAAGDFQSHQTGSWSLTSTWEQFDGVSWITPAPSAPANFTTTVTIQGIHNVTLNVNVTENPTGTLIVDGTLTFSGGLPAKALTVNGNLKNNGA